MSVCNYTDRFREDTYSENASLTAFLNSLSYHKVGASVFAEQIMGLNPPKDWNVLDIGCGDGQFTYELLRVLKQKQLAPASITAIDPDANNLMSYKQRLREFRDIHVYAHSGVVERLPLGQWFVVLLSHCLYQFMENPYMSETMKNQVLGSLTTTVTKNGGLLISMASRTSPAYEYKRRVLEYARLVDRSVFGEDIAIRLEGLDIVFSQTICDSYMDVTKLLTSGKRELLDWTRYFCRLSVEQVEHITLDILHDILCSVSKKFTELPPHLAAILAAAPAACGSPGKDSIVLLHKECFIVTQL